jgi:hypothetical protein
MLRRLIVVTALAAGMSIAAAVALATPALAKGPSQARITGPGLVHAIVVSGGGEPGLPGKLGSLAEQTSLFTRLVRCRRRRASTGPAAHPTAERIPRPAVHGHLHGARRHPAARPAVRADSPERLPARARRAGHLHATRPARLRTATPGHRMVSGQSPANPHARPARRSTGRTGGAADPPSPCRASRGSASIGLTNPRLAHRVHCGRRGRSARRHRAVAASSQGSRRA